MLAFITGDDAWAAERAVGKLATELASDGAPVDVWRVSGSEVDPATLADRLATQPLFGGGTLAVIDQPEPLLRSAAGRELVDAAMNRIAPGNGLAFVTLDDPERRRPASLDQLQQAVADRSGQVLSFRSPTRDRMHAFILERARESGIEIDPAAARLLGERVGGWVREGDVDRRRQAQIAVAELEKLGLFRPDGRIGVEDVRALVAEAVPGSGWAFLDAVGARRSAEAATLLGRLLADGLPLPVIVVQLHRRLRSIIEIREHLDSGGRVEALPRILKMKAFRAEKLAEQARAWSLAELEAALDALFELDVIVKGLEGVAASDAELELSFELWLAERVLRN
jgi:DNA polymerase III delta subunit